MCISLYFILLQIIECFILDEILTEETNKIDVVIEVGFSLIRRKYEFCS
jgi:hypothetical protein